MKLEYKSEVIEFTISYSKRKSIGIKISPPGLVSVAAPSGLPREVVKDVVEEKAEWILKKLAEVRTRQSLRVEKAFVEGEAFMYLGKTYSLAIHEDKGRRKAFVKIESGKLNVYTPSRAPELLRGALELWYREETKQRVLDCIQRYQPYFEVKPSGVQIKEQKRRWGSCTSKRKLLFNWRISMAPIEILDYIVVHEMCHMIHMNHSKAYWMLVQSLVPDYKEKMAWLKDQGIRLQF